MIVFALSPLCLSVANDQDGVASYVVASSGIMVIKRKMNTVES
jgi:hypothetical protein